VSKKNAGEIYVPINFIPENKFPSTVIRVTFYENKYSAKVINMADKQEFTREFKSGCYFMQQQDSHLHCKRTFYYDHQLKLSF